MHKRLVVNIFSSLLLGAALISAPVYAAEKTVVNISKVDGMPWFNRMGEGVVQAGKEFNLNASQVGPSSTDAPQQVKIIEDLIARKVDAITIVPNDANVLEPVFKKARDAGIVVLTNESPGQPSANWDVEIIDNEKLLLNTWSIWPSGWVAKAATLSMSVALRYRSTTCGPICW